LVLGGRGFGLGGDPLRHAPNPLGAGLLRLCPKKRRGSVVFWGGALRCLADSEAPPPKKTNQKKGADKYMGPRTATQHATQQLPSCCRSSSRPSRLRLPPTSCCARHSEPIALVLLHFCIVTMCYHFVWHAGLLPAPSGHNTGQHGVLGV
jgi:hypothetical protein